MLKKVLTFSLLISMSAFAYVDYWGFGTPQPQKKVKIRKETKTVLKKENAEKPNKDILAESIKWYEEKIKKEKPPVEYYYFLNPKKYAKYYIAWMKWKKRKINDLTRPVLLNARLTYESLDEQIFNLNRKGYVLFYFYRPDCPYCKAEEPEIHLLEVKGLKVIRVNVYNEPSFAMKWRVYITPTMILASKKEKKAFRIEGFMPATELINKFTKMVKEK